MLRPPPRSPLFPYTTLFRSLRRSDDTYRWFRVRAEAERDADGTPTMLSGSIRDVTEQHETERALIEARDRKSTRLNSSHGYISYAVFCLKKKKQTPSQNRRK